MPSKSSKGRKAAAVRQTVAPQTQTQTKQPSHENTSDSHTDVAIDRGLLSEDSKQHEPSFPSPIQPPSAPNRTSTHVEPQHQPAVTTEPAPRSQPRQTAAMALNGRTQDALGRDPFVVACISCDSACLVTDHQPIDRSRLGLRVTNTDTFFPTVCSQCEQAQGHMFCQTYNVANPPGRHMLMPQTVSTKMVTSWFVYKHFKERVGAVMDENDGPYKLVVRTSDLLLDGSVHGEARLYFFGIDRSLGGQASEHIKEHETHRKDLFFGQFPSRR